VPRALEKELYMSIIRKRAIRADGMRRRVSFAIAASILKIGISDLMLMVRRGQLAFEYIAETYWFDPGDIDAMAKVRRDQ
jgi:hypothetical protein